MCPSEEFDSEIVKLFFYFNSCRVINLSLCYLVRSKRSGIGSNDAKSFANLRPIVPQLIPPIVPVEEAAIRAEVRRPGFRTSVTERKPNNEDVINIFKEQQKPENNDKEPNATKNSSINGTEL